jgi:outer membrane protein OmpA-like peptidoglycan-associated protein
MREIVRLLKHNSNLFLEIYGFCDSRGGIEENNELSEKRANNVLRYFNEIGINTDAAIVKGYGKSFSRDEKTEQERQRNRRVEVKIIEYIRKNR